MDDHPAGEAAFSDWPAPPRALRLQAGELHVFRLDLRPGCDDEAAVRLLDSAELARARRYRFEDARRRFICARGRLRQVLGFLLGMDPAAPALAYNEYGKPFLPDSPARFNLSHSRDLALLAVTWGQEVGVDVEAVRVDVDYAAIAARFFAREEVDALNALPPAGRAVGFFNCWTRKEAYLKARGLGLKIPLSQFAVTVAPGEPARLLHPEPGASGEWAMFALYPAPGFCAAAVVEGEAPRLFCWAWEDEPG